jgi:hypothetical protein
MGFISDRFDNYFDGWRGEDVARRRVLKKRDDVAGTTNYKHPKSVKQASRHGLWPLIHCVDGQTPRLECIFKTGYIQGYSGFRHLILNADGKILTWEGQLLTFPVLDGQAFMATIPCDEKWLQHLDAVYRSDVAVWRMVFEMRQARGYITKPAERDFVVKDWNKDVIGDMLAVYQAILPKPPASSPQAAQPQRPPAQPTAQPPTQPAAPPPSQASPVAWGPFRLMPDGSIVEPNAGLAIPPGVAIGGLKVGGYTLHTHPSGAYILVDSQGATAAAQFHQGRWRPRRVLD